MYPDKPRMTGMAGDVASGSRINHGIYTKSIRKNPNTQIGLQRLLEHRGKENGYPLLFPTARSANKYIY